MKNKSFYIDLLGVISLIGLGVIYWGFYSPHERISTYIIVVSLFALSLLLLLITSILSRKKVINARVQLIFAFSFIGFNILLGTFSYFQFNYVLMPYDFHVSDPFPTGYEYNDLKGDVRIEYYARDYYGEDEIYRESYDKDEIEEFLSFFKDIDTRMDYAEQGSPDIYKNWVNDIHVMIRNMDDDDPESGFYVMSIDIVDTSDYALKISGGGVVVFYEVPDDLKDFIEEHLLLDK